MGADYNYMPISIGFDSKTRNGETTNLSETSFESLNQFQTDLALHQRLAAVLHRCIKKVEAHTILVPYAIGQTWIQQTTNSKTVDLADDQSHGDMRQPSQWAAATRGCRNKCFDHITRAAVDCVCSVGLVGRGNDQERVHIDDLPTVIDQRLLIETVFTRWVEQNQVNRQPVPFRSQFIYQRFAHVLCHRKTMGRGQRPPLFEYPTPRLICLRLTCPADRANRQPEAWSEQPLQTLGLGDEQMRLSRTRWTYDCNAKYFMIANIIRQLTMTIRTDSLTSRSATARAVDLVYRRHYIHSAT